MFVCLVVDGPALLPAVFPTQGRYMLSVVFGGCCSSSSRGLSQRRDVWRGASVLEDKKM